MSDDVIVRLLMLGMVLDGKPDLVQILADASEEIERLRERVSELEGKVAS